MGNWHLRVSGSFQSATFTLGAERSLNLNWKIAMKSMKDKVALEPVD